MGRRGILFAFVAAAILIAAAFWRADRPDRAPGRTAEGTREVPAEPARPPEEAPEGETGTSRVVFGRVVDARTGSPVAGATVCVIPSGADGSADADGRFEIGGRHGSLVRCAAGAPGHRLTLGPWLKFERGERVDAGTIRLGAGLTLAGRVVDAAGTGVATDVRLEREGPVSEEWRAMLGEFGWQEADESGRFAFHGLDDGLFRVSVSVYDPAADDDCRLTKEHLRAGGDDVVFVFPTLRKPVEGTISVSVTLPDGRLLPRGTLRAGTDDSGTTEGIVDGSGSASVEGTGPAWLAVECARDESEAPLPYRPAFLPDVTPRKEPYRVVLEPGDTIEGVALTTDGLPLRATVTFVPLHLDRDGDGVVRLAGAGDQAESDADGRFRCIRLSAGEYELRARCAGYTGVLPFVTARTGTRDVRIEMRRAGRIRLRVVAPEGELLGGGTVTLLRRGPAGYVERGTQTVSIGGSSRSSSFETSFDGLREGEVYRIRASVAGRGWGRYAPVDIEAVAGDGDPVEVRVSHGRSLCGRVLRSSGEPVAAAEVRVRVPAPQGRDENEHWASDHGQAVALSALDGRFELRGVPEGDFWITCEATGLAQRAGPLAVGARDKSVEIRMEPALEVSGRLVGDPPLDFRIEWIPVGLAGEAATIPREAEFSGADGFFALRTLPSGTLRIDGWRPWADEDDRYVNADGVQAGATDLRLPVLKGARVEGTVVDRDGRPIFLAEVFVDASWGRRRATTDDKGRFVLHALPPGRHLVRVAQGSGDAVAADAPGPPVRLVR